MDTMPPREQTPYQWAAEKRVDRALVEGAAVLARWPAGNLKDGSLKVPEEAFDKALAAFNGLEIG